MISVSTGDLQVNPGGVAKLRSSDTTSSHRRTAMFPTTLKSMRMVLLKEHGEHDHRTIWYLWLGADNSGQQSVSTVVRRTRTAHLRIHHDRAGDRRVACRSASQRPDKAPAFPSDMRSTAPRQFRARSPVSVETGGSSRSARDPERLSAIRCSGKRSSASKWGILCLNGEARRCTAALRVIIKVGVASYKCSI